GSRCVFVPYSGSLHSFLGVCVMKRIVLTSFALLLAISATSPNCWAADVQLISSGNFNTGANWSDGLVPSAGDGNVHIIQGGPTAQVISTAYWRVGNNGPTVDTGLQGNGFLDVEGTFNVRAMFIGVNDGTGVVQVRGNGKIILTQQNDNPGFADIDMDFNHSP